MYLSYASAHAHNSSNHSYVSMTTNMDSVNEHELFSLESLLHPDIYRSLFDNGIPESSAPLLDLPIPPSINFLPESHESSQRGPRPHDDSEDPLHSENIVASTKPLLFLDDAELKQFVDQQKNCNMKRKTESDLCRWYTWCTSVGEKCSIGEIPPAELLGHFYIKVHKTNGEMYEPDSLTAIQRSIDCHLSRDLHKPYSIIRDQQFASSHDKLNAARKSLKKAGKGNKPHAAETLEAADIQSLWSHGLLGDSTPEALLNSVWLMLSMHLGLCGRDEHYKLTYGDLEVKETTDGKRYDQFNERDTKTRTGDACQGTRAFRPKMWSTPHNPEQCPARLFELYLSKRPTDCCDDDSLFYLAINYDAKPGGFWYKRQKLGMNQLGNIMKIMASKAGLQGKKKLIILHARPVLRL